MMNWTLLWMLMLAGCGDCVRERPYINFKLFKITGKSADSLNRILENLDTVDDLSRDHFDNSVVVAVAPGDVNSVHVAVDNEDAVLEVLHDNLQDSIDEEYRHFDMKRKKRQAITLEDSVKEFMTLDEIYAFQDRVVSSCNGSVRVEKVKFGSSAEGKPLNVIMISEPGSSAGKKTIFIESGVHAREWLSPATANYIIYQLACNEDNADMLKLYNWEIASIVNPDGYHFTHTGARLWRKNRQSTGTRCIGTDLNRNFDAGFGKRGASTNVCSETYRGPSAYSAPESRALRDYVLGISSNIVSYLSIHAYGQYILLPWGYKGTRPADYDTLVSYAEAAETAMNRPFKIDSAYAALYPAAGVSSDFARDTAGIALSYTWELMPNSGSGSSGFAPSESMVSVYTPIIWKGIKGYVQAVANDAGASETTTTTTTQGPTQPATSSTALDLDTLTRPPHVRLSLWNFIQRYRNTRLYPLLLKRFQIIP